MAESGFMSWCNSICLFVINLLMLIMAVYLVWSAFTAKKERSLTDICEEQLTLAKAAQTNTTTLLNQISTRLTSLVENLSGETFLSDKTKTKNKKRTDKTNRKRNVTWENDNLSLSIDNLLNKP